jgi:type I restriction enzyme, S subunit
MRWTKLPEFDKRPPGWALSPLQKEVAFVFGQSPDSEHYNEQGEGLPFLQGNADFTETFPRTAVYTRQAGKRCEPKDTLISVRAPVGELCRADQQYALGRGVAALRPLSMNPDFFFHAMNRWRKPLQRAAQGSTFDAVTGRHFSQLQCLVPPPSEQTLIAEMLTAADDQIRALEVQIRKAQRVAMALDQAHFAAGPHDVRFPYEYGTARTIPTGWDSMPLGKFADVTSGITLNQDREAADNGVRYLTVINVHRGRIDLTEVRHLEMRGNEAETKRIAPGDIMVIEGHANPAEIGRAALATEREEGMSFQNHLFRIRVADTEQIKPRFLVRALNSSRIRRHWAATANTSSGLNTINRTALRRLILPVPKPTEQDAIIARLEAAEAVVTTLQDRLIAARRVKQSLLQSLLTGKIRLKP